MTTKYLAEVCLPAANDSLAFLPEGPYPYGPSSVSWVAIQHGADSKVGSLNILDLKSGENRTFELDGRPGFAFPTENPDVFAMGVERKVGFYDIAEKAWLQETGGVDESVEGTIINDGVICGDSVIFGTKDLKFAEPKAALYVWNTSSGEVKLLRPGQTCSNGKAVIGNGDKVIDIDTPTKLVKEHTFDAGAGELTEVRTALDLNDLDSFPDGMILTPDEKSVIIAMYNPNRVDVGEARQYGLASGELEAVWQTPLSPRVTCPQLVRHQGGVKLVLTTAVEGMDESWRADLKNAGSLFIADTPFDELPEAPVLPAP